MCTIACQVPGAEGHFPPGRPKEYDGPLGGQRSTQSDKRGSSLSTSRGRGTGFAGPQAQRPLGGQRSTRSDKRGGHLS